MTFFLVHSGPWIDVLDELKMSGWVSWLDDSVVDSVVDGISSFWRSYGVYIVGLFRF